MNDDVRARLVSIQHDVRTFFGWSYEDDVESAAQLARTMNQDAPFSTPSWSPEARAGALEALILAIGSSDVLVIGAAAEPEAVRMALDEGTCVVAADGAAGACEGIVRPHAVVTDLDGGEHLERAVRNGSTLVVHAHGDNRKRWQACFARWSTFEQPPPLVLTHQTDETMPGMHNPGGFTDGDRAVCCLLHWGVNPDRIRCIGFDSSRLGRWSGQTDPARKLEKLGWMDTVLRLALPGME